MRALRHVCLFTLRPGVDADEVIGRLRALGDAGDDGGDAVLEWRVERSLDERKGVVIAEVGLFASEEAFARWRDSAAHREAGAFMAERADWVVADYLE